MLDDPRYVCPTCGKPKTQRARQCGSCARADGTMHGGRPTVAANLTRVICPGCGGSKSYDAKLCMKCRNRGDDRPFPLGGTERARHGCIVSFEGDNGRRLTLHRVGPTRVALKRACDDALAIDASFKVTAISTPDSIYTDPKGHRRDGHGYPQMPETISLTGELRAMLHPRLVRG